jgi:ribonuclease G
MSSELLVNVTPQETRVAVIENGMLQELYLEREATRGILGNIYVGRVARVMSGMQAAFIDVGIERTGFLHVKDLMVARDADVLPPISEVLHQGEKIIVQVVKEPVGTKGARLSGQISLAARNLVYLPDQVVAGVSQRVEDQVEKERLRAILEKLTLENVIGGGAIARTVAEGASEAELAMELEFLSKVWRKSLDMKASSKPPLCIYEDLPLCLRVLRDFVGDEVERIRIDSSEAFASATKFSDDMVPELSEKLELYAGERPLFDMYSVEDEIERALHRKVPLKSGGYLIIDPTEAMTTIDVNTGAYLGKNNLDDTLYKTNLEAASAIARQLRLRNIGGIVIVDFIDMVNEEHKRQVMRALERSLARDRVKTYITDMSPLGLVEVTRKRTRDSLSHAMSEDCPVCSGRGRVKSAQTVCYQIFREIVRDFKQYQANKYMILASRDVIEYLLDEEASALADIQDFIERPLRLQVDTDYQREQYEIVLS